MKRVVVYGVLVMSAGAGCASYPESAAVIPHPLWMERKEGTFTVGRGTRVLVAKEVPDLSAIGRGLADILGKATRRSVGVEPFDGAAVPDEAVLLSLAADKRGLGEEGYELVVSPRSVVIRGLRPVGVFYGVQTLRQLLPPDIEGGAPAGPAERTIPCMEIEDRPRFSWRGMHLDVARHFFDKDFVKRYIDHVSRYKINVLHLYLTDDQGWRIEIKRYPRLTEVGAWRQGTVKHTADGPGDALRHGGYYRQEDIREIVRYAQERFVTIVPGISMPGHSQAALAAYPDLSSTGGPFEVWTRWGVSKEVMDPGKEEVFQFVEGVLAEVIDLFPGRYVHTGGDEVPRDRWKTSPHAQARMRTEGLRSEDELQSYFTRRVERFLNSKGRQLIGWDEIIAGGLAPNAVVMSWRGTSGGITAARAGHDVIMTPHEETYFNYRQDSAGRGPGHPGHLSLLRVYHFEPTHGMTPAEAGHVLGGQACLWTEYVPTPADVEYLLFPRLLAMAEVLWSPPNVRDDRDFVRRAALHRDRLRRMGVNCGDTEFPTQE